LGAHASCALYRSFLNHVRGSLMKLSKLPLAVVGAIVLLGALVSSAGARSLSVSAQTSTALWARMDFSGPFGTVECEIRLSGSFHGRTSAKAVNSLSGYITEARILRCTRGGATIHPESPLAPQIS